MTKEKEHNTSNQTKAGLMEKNKNKVESLDDEADKKEDPENTPKISKEKAERFHNGEPLH